MLVVTEVSGQGETRPGGAEGTVPTTSQHLIQQIRDYKSPCDLSDLEARERSGHLCFSYMYFS